MAFTVQVTGLQEVAGYEHITEVAIDRRIYEHSTARVVMNWNEEAGYPERSTANVTAKALNSPVDVTWKENDGQTALPCFHGYVERAYGERCSHLSKLVLECISYSKRTDLVPRYRAFQACKLLDICREIAGAEPLFKVGQPGDMDFDIDLSLQYGETDYAYLSRMLHAWGIPMAVIDSTGEVILGARGTAAASQFPDVSFDWTDICFGGAIDFFPKREGGGSGPSGTARGQAAQLAGQLKTAAADYYPIPDSQPIRERVSAVNCCVDTAVYHLRLESAVLPFSPGEVVRFEGQDHIIRAVDIVGHPNEDTANQEFELQPFALPYQPERRTPVWPSRTVWAHVVDNEKDPDQRGRIQVKFEWESKNPPSLAWLHTLTPYGGGKSPNSGRAGEYNGLYALPEVGERVLVEFLGEWDSEAVVIGVVREHPVNPMFNAKDTKRWRTPSGNELSLTTKGSTEVVRIRCKDKIFFESKIDGPNASVYIMPGDSEEDRIHIQKGGGPPRIDITCGGEINVKATQKLHLEGQIVQIKASGGNINIDGAPNVMINCAPVPMTPLQTQKFEEALMSTSSKPRKLPTPPLPTAASAPAGKPGEQKEQKKTWIEIRLIDEDTKEPIPNERYELRLPDGSTKTGRLDGSGRARVDGIDDGTAMVCYPDRYPGMWRKV